MRQNRLNFFIFFLLAVPAAAPVAGATARTPPRPEPSARAVTAPAPKPLTLYDCYRLALKRSETVAIRKEEIEKTEAQFWRAAGDAAGDVNFVMTDRRQEPQKNSASESGVGSTFNAAERREKKFVITQPIFRGFKSLGALIGAGSLRSRREFEWVRAEELLFLDVAEAFYSMLRYQKDVETIEGIRQSLKERVDELREREKIGRSRTSEVVTATVGMKTIEAELALSRGLRVLSRFRLEFLAGAPIAPEQIREEEIPSAQIDPPAGEDQAIEERADVRAGEAAAKTAWQNVIIAQSDLWPKITLDADTYERREGFQSGIDWDLLLTIDIPIAKGGETLGKVKEALSDWRQAKFSYSQAKRQAALEIKEAHQNWITARERLDALDQAVKASQQNFLLQKEEYSRNLVSNLDVLESLRSLFQTKRDANQAFYEMKMNYRRSQVAEGHCCGGAAGEDIHDTL